MKTLSSLREFLEKTWAELLALHDKRGEAREVLLARTDAIDRLLVSLYQTYEACRTALVSQGGYGRRELCLFSDIDLLVLFEGKADRAVKTLCEKLSQTLWDAGLEVGLATRTVKDCRRLMEEDLTIMTSLLDARLLAGDRSLFQEFEEMFVRYFRSAQHRENFFRQKVEEHNERRLKQGGSSALLEPNLKEGEGGLRDYHTLYWLGRAFYTIREFGELVPRGLLLEDEYRRLKGALNFLWSVRTELHRLAGRRVDQLLFEYQEPIALWFGYRNTGEFFGVELFMQQYYRHAGTIRQLSDKGIRRLHGEEPRLFPAPRVPFEDKNVRLVEGKLTLASPDLLEREPLYLLKIFDLARRLKVEIDDFTQEKIEKNLARVEGLRSLPEAGHIFRKMLSEPRGLGVVLGLMNESGVLQEFLPEFGKLRFRVQHDIYHLYTVDQHSIFAVEELGKVSEGEYALAYPTFTDVSREVDRMDLTAFAILYHDIGKGEGRGHVEKGALLIRQAGARLGFSPEDLEKLEFLERSHLIMTHLAFRRDLEDQNLIIQFARAVESLDLLNRLCLLTFCDVKAVSPVAMTGWKGSLLEYLYLKTREVILKGSFTPERLSAVLPKIRATVERFLPLERDRAAAEGFFQTMPPRYLIATPPATIASHVRLWQRLSFEKIVFEARLLEKEGANEVTLLTVDSPALFSKMAGLFTAYNINILDAELSVSREGYALHRFRVTDHRALPIQDEEKWKRVEEDLRRLLAGQARIEELVAEKFRPSLFKSKLARVVPSRIDIDNDVSAYYTVIDIYTHDRPGLLYQMTSTLAALGLYVDVSKVSTKVDQVADTFYVRDIFGHKVMEEGRLQKIKEILLKVVENPPTPDWRPPVS